MQVLIVEDEEALSTLLRYNLEAEGFLVDSAARGDDAELLLAERIPDLVLLDWMLPGLSGIELCRRIRAAPQSLQGRMAMAFRTKSNVGGRLPKLTRARRWTSLTTDERMDPGVNRVSRAASTRNPSESNVDDTGVCIPNLNGILTDGSKTTTERAACA